MSVDPIQNHPAAPGADAVVDATGGPSWQLFPNGLLVFERVLGPEGPSRLLFSSLEACIHPECTCREVTLSAVELELAAPPDSYEEFREQLDEGEAKFFQIDLDAGLVDRIRGSDSRPPLDEDWLSYLRSQVDGDLLDRLHERWLSAKGLKSREGWNSIDWSKRDPDELVVWEEMFPDDRVDHFLLEDGRVFIASEHYCKKPGCSCSAARVDFTEIETGGKYRHVGSVRVALPGGASLEREASRRNGQLVETLWAAYQLRHRVAARLSERSRRIQQIGALLARAPLPAPASAAPRVGRNDPCPCGSGKKFKRCCGA